LPEASSTAEAVDRTLESTSGPAVKLSVEDVAFADTPAAVSCTSLVAPAVATVASPAVPGPAVADDVERVAVLVADSE
jgi:hypothetical protein